MRSYYVDKRDDRGRRERNSCEGGPKGRRKGEKGGKEQKRKHIYRMPSNKF